MRRDCRRLRRSTISLQSFDRLGSSSSPCNSTSASRATAFSGDVMSAGTIAPKFNRSETGESESSVRQKSCEFQSRCPRARIDPFALAVPAFDIRRSQQLLTHSRHVIPQRVAGDACPQRADGANDCTPPGWQSAGDSTLVEKKYSDKKQLAQKPLDVHLRAIQQLRPLRRARRGPGRAWRKTSAACRRSKRGVAGCCISTSMMSVPSKRPE